MAVWRKNLDCFNSEVSAYASIAGVEIGYGELIVLNSMNRVANQVYWEKANG